MNVGGALISSLHRLGGAERGGAGRVRSVVFSALLTHHVDFARTDGRDGRGGGPEPGRRQAGSRRTGGACRGA